MTTIIVLWVLAAILATVAIRNAGWSDPDEPSEWEKELDALERIHAGRKVSWRQQIATWFVR